MFIKAEMPPVISIITGRSINRGRVCRFFKKRAIEAITPLSSKAIEIINKERTVIVAEFENPEIASSGETKPVKAREAMIKKAILSTGNISNANRNMVIIRIEKTSIISVVIGSVFYHIKITSEIILAPNKLLKY